jgi:hypothetical protein
MGDRSVTGFAANGVSPVIYLYSHWGASSQVADLQEAIRAAESRWDDADYATRIAISYLIGDDWKRETNYGLSVGSYCSPDLPYALVVRWDAQSVVVYQEGTENVISVIDFADFLALTSENLEPVLV